MGDVRNRLDRKSELKLYEWIKAESNYGKLSDKTVSQGAAVVSQELGMHVSGSVLVGLVQAMELEPFWRRRLNGDKQQKLELEGEGRGGEALLMGMHEKLKHQAKRLEHHEKSLVQLKQICQNLLGRLEATERPAMVGVAEKESATKKT